MDRSPDFAQIASYRIDRIIHAQQVAQCYRRLTLID
jgi:hypothetical protein